MAGSKQQRFSTETWMSSLPKTCHSSHLWELIIPGSHDAMSYDLDVKSELVGSDTVVPPDGNRNIVKEWHGRQVVNITAQLNAGSRFFDLSIGRKQNDKDPNRLYFVHGLFTHTTVKTALESINNWAVEHPKEIIFLSFSKFIDFGFEARNLHKKLLEFMKDLFGMRLIKKDKKITLQNCWTHHENILIFYDDEEANKQAEFWPKIPYFSADSMDPEQVESQLWDNLIENHDSFCACALTLTLPRNAEAIEYILQSDSIVAYTKKKQESMLKWLEDQTVLSPIPWNPDNGIGPVRIPLKPNFVGFDVVSQMNTSKVIDLNWERMEKKGKK